MSTIFEKYEQPTEVNPESLVKWTEILHKLIDDLNTESVSTAEFEAKVRQDLVNTPVSTDLVEILDDFAHKVFTLIDEDAAAAVHTYELLRMFLPTVKDERDYHTRRLARLHKPRAAVGEDFDEKKSDAENIKSHVENLYNVLDMMKMVPDGYNVKKMKDGSVKPNLPRIPSGPREGGGRKASTHNLRLEVDGVLYDTLVETVLHDVISTGARRINMSDLKSAVEASGQEFSAFRGWTEPVTIADHTVIGRPIAVVEDDETEDDDNGEDETEVE